MSSEPTSAFAAVAAAAGEVAPWLTSYQEEESWLAGEHGSACDDVRVEAYSCLHAGVPLEHAYSFAACDGHAPSAADASAAEQHAPAPHVRGDAETCTGTASSTSCWKVRAWPEAYERGVGTHSPAPWPP